MVRLSVINVLPYTSFHIHSTTVNSEMLIDNPTYSPTSTTEQCLPVLQKSSLGPQDELPNPGPQQASHVHDQLINTDGKENVGEVDENG